ncbi:MAG TPA: hypothetical protein VFE05_21840 [Longimicrobiaceae bacterium]|jgi:YD repeat-containing protein|nr:hypothetical protein [Longimicrobiaceae bacterium]
MIRHRNTLALSLGLLAAAPLHAQQDTTRYRSPQGAMSPQVAREMAAMGEPDVYLNVPNLKVREINLEVTNLRARLSLEARLANLLSLNAGADVGIERVTLRISGVEAQAMLVVRLDNVARIIDRTLTTIDRNPQILERLLQSVDNTVGTVGGVANTALQPGGVVSQTVGTVGSVANTALQPGGVVGQTLGTVGGTLNNVTQPGGLLSQTVNTLGQTVQTTLDQTGNLVERTTNTTGQLVNQRTLGAITSLPVLRTTTNAAGQAVKQVRLASGAVVEYVTDQAGRIVSSRVVQQPGGRR